MYGPKKPLKPVKKPMPKPTKPVKKVMPKGKPKM